MESVFVRLADQIPTAVLFAVFILIWSDRLSRAQDKRDEMMRQFWQQTINSILAGMSDIRCGQEEHDKWVREHTPTPTQRRRQP